MRDDEKKDDIRSTSVVVVATEDPRLERKRFLAVYWVEMKCFKVFGGGGGVLGHVKVKRSRKRAKRERERVNSAIIIICHTQSSSIQIMSFFVAVLGISPFSILMPSAPGCSSFLDSSEAGFTAPLFLACMSTTLSR